MNAINHNLIAALEAVIETKTEPITKAAQSALTGYTLIDAQIAELRLELRRGLADKGVVAADGVTAADIANEFCAGDIANEISTDDIAANFDVSDIASSVPLDELASALDYEQLAAEISGRKIAQNVSYHGIVKELDYDELAAFVDCEDVAKQLDARVIAHNLDYGKLASECAHHLRYEVERAVAEALAKRDEARRAQRWTSRLRRWFGR
jgi:hypothetical protein